MSNLLSREYIATNPRLAIIKICTFLHLVHFSWVCFAFVVFFFTSNPFGSSYSRKYLSKYRHSVHNYTIVTLKKKITLIPQYHQNHSSCRFPLFHKTVFSVTLFESVAKKELNSSSDCYTS